MESLPASIHGDLFTSSSTTLAVFRMLPELARIYIARWLLVQGPLSKDDFAAWRRDADDEHNAQAIIAMKSMHIIRERAEELKFNSTFRDSLQRALIGGYKKSICAFNHNGQRD